MRLNATYNNPLTLTFLTNQDLEELQKALNTIDGLIKKEWKRIKGSDEDLLQAEGAMNQLAFELRMALRYTKNS